MDNEWRLLNLGEINWLDTQAIYHALALFQSQNNTPNTLVITWPNRSLVCVGLHQVLEHSVELEYIESQGLPLVRRSTGGGSVFLDNNQVFYQVICSKKEYRQSLQEFYKYFLTPTVSTYNYFGIPAEYSPINDIIADGRKISGNGAVSYDNSRILVGNFIFSFPSKEMSKILKVPEEKFRDKIANSLEERMGSFEFFLETVPTKNLVVQEYIRNFETDLGIKLVEGSLTNDEKRLLEDIKETYQKEDWLYYVEKDKRDLFQQKIMKDTYFAQTTKKFQGGLMQLFIHFDESKIAEIIISGDFSLSPPNILEELQYSLEGIKVDENEIYRTLENFFISKEVDIPGISITDITQLIIETYLKLRK